MLPSLGQRNRVNTSAFVQLPSLYPRCQPGSLLVPTCCITQGRVVLPLRLQATTLTCPNRL